MLQWHLEPHRQCLNFGLQTSLYASYLWLPEWTQSCLDPWGRAPTRAPFGPEQDREVLYHLHGSQPLGMVRDKKVALNLTQNSITAVISILQYGLCWLQVSAA